MRFLLYYNKNRNHIKIFVLLLFSTLFGAISITTLSEIPKKPLTGREVQLKVKNQSTGDDHIWRWDMRLINKNGYVRKRIAYRYMKETNGLRKIIVRFHSPADIRKTGLLTWENANADDTQFLYLPALKRTRRIATADKEQSFVGTDFNYEDMENLSVDNYTYSAATTEMRDGKECYVYDAFAKPGANTVYSRMRQWTSKKSWIRIYVEYYGKRGKLFKIATAKNIQKIDGLWTPLYIAMENLQDKHKTEIITSNIIYNSGLSDDLFSLMNLETGSMENF